MLTEKFVEDLAELLDSHDIPVELNTSDRDLAAAIAQFINTMLGVKNDGLVSKGRGKARISNDKGKSKPGLKRLSLRPKTPST